ncbi:MAG: VanZ family protein [Candidatus Omnitrophica bacterium]|nr:VanZ family protein [Candidatus Omnitrophota bacterium]
MDWIKSDKPIFNWVPTLIWIAVISLFSTLPLEPQFPLTVGYFDKLAHFFEYTILSILISRAFYRQNRNCVYRSLLFTLILSGGYGIVMELIQLYVPGREASSIDVIFNFIGALTGVILSKVVLWQK